jgi:ACR3 family arsenite efflux pump ArsB
MVPLLLYFMVMFFGTFAAMWWWSNRSRGSGREVRYEEAAVQSFTAASNNFVRCLWLYHRMID